MPREFFKNLPNTTTPLTAPRLNNLLDGGESMGNIVVDSIKGKNLFNKDFATLNSALATDGSIVARNGYMISDYIEVEENTDYYLSNVSGSNQVRTCGYFNSSKSFISYESITGDVVVSGKITTPSNTKYIRVSVNMNNSNIQVEKGSIATNYTQYQGIGYVSGSNENGSYIKYDDGTLICYHKKQFSGVNITTANGSLYTATLTYPFEFPISFIEEPVLNVTVQDIPDFTYCFPYIVRRNIEQIISIVLLRPSAVSNATTKVGYIAIGRWK